VPDELPSRPDIRPPELLVRDLDTIRNHPFAIDIWHFGCLMYEILTGDQLFHLYHDIPPERMDGADDTLLVSMYKTLGRMPRSLFLKWPRSHLHFSPDGRYAPQDDDEADFDPEDYTRYEWRFGDAFLPEETMETRNSWKTGPLEMMFRENIPSDMPADEEKTVVGLIRQMLQYDAKSRPSAEDIWYHPWFCENQPLTSPLLEAFGVTENGEWLDSSS
jgi:serine/threonine protein kinase